MVKTWVGMGLFCFLLPMVHGFDMGITEKELGGEFRARYDRVFLNYFDMAIHGSLELKNRLALNGGIALEFLEDTPNLNVFTKGETALPLPVPLYVALTYVYNRMPDYRTTVHSVVPGLSLKGRRAGVSLGSPLRFTSFYAEPAVFEMVFSFLVYVNFYYSDTAKFGMRCANFDDYLFGNTGAYFLTAYYFCSFSTGISLIHELTLYQTGSITFAANIYGLSYKGGVKFQW
ncbi:MAG: hypothetical protein LBG08_07870 [Spirochaetaceae bacterium]|nr:hypothetical protein [Spirochaetaceae bacterium]